MRGARRRRLGLGDPLGGFGLGGHAMVLLSAIGFGFGLLLAFGDARRAVVGGVPAPLVPLLVGVAAGLQVGDVPVDALLAGWPRSRSAEPFGHFSSVRSASRRGNSRPGAAWCWNCPSSSLWHLIVLA